MSKMVGIGVFETKICIIVMRKITTPDNTDRLIIDIYLENNDIENI